MNLPTYVSTAAAATEAVEVHTGEAIWLTVFAGILLALFHVTARHIQRILFVSERITNSLFGGMTAAYVFLYLMPELELTHDLIGDAMHYLILLGFLMFYGAEHYSRTRYSRSHADDRTEALTFYIRLFFIWVYNALFVYTMPERIQESLLFFTLNTAAIGLHILHVDYRIARRHETLFDSFGRYALATAPLIGAGIDWLDGLPKEIVSDTLTAFLAGFILLNVFSEELPQHDRSDFRWFLAGVIAYALLIYSRHYMG